MTEITIPFEEARKRSGIGKTKLYDIINSGEIEAKKAGRSTLVVVESLKAYLDRLPAYRPQSQRAAA